MRTINFKHAKKTQNIGIFFAVYTLIRNFAATLQQRATAPRQTGKKIIRKKMEKQIDMKILTTTLTLQRGLACLCLCVAMTLTATAQPWAKKAAQAVFTLKTFGADGTLLGSTNGFFVSSDGEALSSFAPFKGASRAVVIDAQGKEWPVESLIGANEMYDVAKFNVAVRKPTTLPIATANATDGSTLWLLPYSVKKVPVCKSGIVSKAEQFQGEYAYYTIDMPTNDQQVSCPLLNEQGEVVGILQPAADQKSTVSYAVSASFAAALHMTGLGMNDPAMRATAIEKALPDEQDQALLALFIANSAMDSVQYANYINRFINKFPQLSDGYEYRARNYAAAGNFTEADNDMRQAIKVAEKKDEAHYQYSLLVYQKELTMSNQPYEPWTLDFALSEAKEAYTINPQPVYLQQQGQILYAQKKYDEAFQTYQQLASTSLRSADTFYAAAQCKLQQGDREAALAQLDSAVNTFNRPYLRAAAPYLLARAQLLYEVGKYRPAVNDYNDYESLMKTQISHGFYYLRAQAEVEGHLYQQALNDIKKAIEMAPQEAIYYGEKASLELRVGLTDDAIATAEEQVRIAPNDSDGYLFLGLGQCIKGKKAEGIQNLQKAKELGNDQAQTLIEKYSK